MSSRTILLAFLGACAAAACAAAAYAADWSTFVAASNRADDGLILDILKDADFQTSSEICLAIGSRSDPYAADILSWLLAGFSRTVEYKTEHLIRLALASLFDPAQGDQQLRGRLDANAAVVSDLVRGIDGFRDPQLRGLIVRLLPRLGEPDRLSALMKVGAGILDHLRQTGGILSPSDTGLALDYLDVVQEIGNADFMEPCLSISRFSRDQAVVQKARQASLLVASRPR